MLCACWAPVSPWLPNPVVIFLFVCLSTYPLGLCSDAVTPEIRKCFQLKYVGGVSLASAACIFRCVPTVFTSKKLLPCQVFPCRVIEAYEFLVCLFVHLFVCFIVMGLFSVAQLSICNEILDSIPVVVVMENTTDQEIWSVLFGELHLVFLMMGKA